VNFSDSLIVNRCCQRMWLAETWCIYQSRILLFFGCSFFSCLSFCIPHERTGKIKHL